MFRNSDEFFVLSGLCILKWNMCLRVNFFLDTRDIGLLHSPLQDKRLNSPVVSVIVYWVNVSIFESRYVTLFRDEKQFDKPVVILRTFRYVYEISVMTELRTTLVPKLSSGFSSTYEKLYYSVESLPTYYWRLSAVLWPHFNVRAKN